MRDDLARLVDIWLACRDVQEFASGVTEEQYRRDRKLQKALCMSLEVIGEAARAISQEFKDQHPEIPWPKMVGLLPARSGCHLADRSWRCSGSRRRA